MTSAITELNRRFEELTGNKVTLHSGTEYAWFDWLRYRSDRFTLEDLRLVVGYLKANQKPKGPYLPNSMRFSNLIGQPDRFEELLSMALRSRKAARRERQPRAPDKPVSQKTQEERRKLGNMLGDWNRKNL